MCKKSVWIKTNYTRHGNLTFSIILLSKITLKPCLLHKKAYINPVTNANKDELN